MIQGDVEYKALLKVWYELEEKRLAQGLDDAERAEFALADARLTQAELRGKAFVVLADDYSQAMVIGDLGGTEL
ncbi:MAG: hypothetical protein H0W34_05220 [Pyrinomonadaceae bacterium]|nr:hypothetical protein [Pyrinomonadaceae bacterium]